MIRVMGRALWPVVGMAVAVALLLTLLPPPRATRAAATSQSLSLVVDRGDGPPVRLEFEIVAPDAASALQAATSAIPQLVPGGVLEPSPTGVTAQWQPWGWAWADDEIPVRVAYNPTGAPDFVGPDAIIAALQTWSSVPTSRFAFAYGGFTDRPASLKDDGPDGNNVIAWQSLPCDTACVLGVTTRELVHESDLVLNSNPAAHLSVGGEVDARTVVLHETGHMAGLEHSCPAPFGPCTEDELNAVMYYAYRGVKRKLTADDIAGISAIYPRQGPPPAITPTPPSDPAAPEIAVILSAGWNLVSLPSGTLGSIMPGIACADSVYRYNGAGWDVWIRDGASALNSLTTAEAGSAYWLHAADFCAHVYEP